jgi:hypothetical protein
MPLLSHFMLNFEEMTGAVVGGGGGGGTMLTGGEEALALVALAESVLPPLVPPLVPLVPLIWPLALPRVVLCGSLMVDMGVVLSLSSRSDRRTRGRRAGMVLETPHENCRMHAVRWAVLERLLKFQGATLNDTNRILD